MWIVWMMIVKPWDLRRVRCRLRQTKIGLLTKAYEPCAATHQLVSAVASGQLARHTGAPLLQSGVAAAEPPFARAPPLSSSAIYLPASGLIARLRKPCGHWRSRKPRRRDHMFHDHRRIG